MNARRAESVGPPRPPLAVASARIAQNAGHFSLRQMPLGNDRTFRVQQDRYPFVVEVEKFEVEVDVHHFDVDVGRRGQGFNEGVSLVTERTTASGEEPNHRVIAIVIAPMRPFTAFVLIALLVLFVGAFVIKMQSIGFTP